MKRLIVLLLALTLVGCANLSHEEKGAATGAIIGLTLGILGGNALDCKGCAAIGGSVGAIGGGALGASWGRTLDELDRRNISHALENQRSGQSLHWTNPDNGSRHAVVAKPARVENGRPCREFYDDVMIGGQKKQLYGKACRTGPNQWELVQ